MLEETGRGYPVAAPVAFQEIQHVEDVQLGLQCAAPDRDRLPDGGDRRMGPWLPTAVSLEDPAPLTPEAWRGLDETLERLLLAGHARGQSVRRVVRAGGV